MKNKKKVKLATSETLVTGTFKKRNWPWLFVLAAAIIPAVFYSAIAIEFFFFAKCGEGHTCNTYYDYTFHYANAINSMLVLIGALVVLAILCAILFVRKRRLILTNTHLIYTKGRKTTKIEVSSIKDVDVGAKSVIVKVPFKKFRFAKLKNKREVYNALNALLQAPVAETTTVVTETVTTAPAVPTVAVGLPTTTDGKLAYFQSLLAAKVITPEQFNKYATTVLKTDFPTLYK